MAGPHDAIEPGPAQESQPPGVCQNGLLGSPQLSTILFVMPEPGHLRLYATTLVALADRGHAVRVAYDKPSRKDRNADALDGAPPSLTTIGAVPPHGGSWRQALSDLGCTIDYVRFLSRRGGTPYLRSRMDRYLPTRAARLRQVRTLPAWAVRGIVTLGALVERAVPVDPSLTRYLVAQQLDALVVTPLVLRGPSGVQQHQLVKAARVAGIPVALAVGSWDHLSSKGLIRVDPDLVIVWNDIQRREAIEQHGVPAERIVVTGAQPFDVWFGREATLGRAEFCARVGLPADRPMVLYAGSSRGIADPVKEIPFVERWLTAVRTGGDALRNASVLVRPHLSNVDAWAGVDLSSLGPVSIWPRVRPSLPMNDLETSDYFHSIYYSAAVVGINTSAMIEASILDKPVLTVEGPDFAATQGGTMHFQYLLPRGGGCVMSAPTFEAHVAQLAEAVAHPDRGRADRARFVAGFVRPNGMDRPAVESVVQAIERLTSLRPRRQADRPAWLAPLRWLVRLATVRTPPEPAG